MSDYEAQINAAYNKKVLGALDIVTRKIALDLQSDLDNSTPVKTGRARSNWLPSINKIRTDTTESTSGSPAINFSGYKLGDKIYITNNLPYIKRLNDGSSTQAPSGFVDGAIMRAKNKVKEVIGVINAKL